MKQLFTRRLRGVAIAATSAAILVSASACLNSLQDSLLEQQQPQVILPVSVSNPTGALGLYTGALGQFRSALNGHNNNQETLWNWEGLMTDEFRSGDTFLQRNNADQRITDPGDIQNLSVYNYLQQARGFARSAINALQQFSPTSTSDIGEMYMEMGFMEMSLAQGYCANIPLGETVGGVPQYTVPITDPLGVFRVAGSRLDTALTFLTASNAQTVYVKNATLITKARIMVDTGNFTGAAALVASIPVSYQYLITYSLATQDNEWWTMAISTKRYSVGDSVNINGDNTPGNRIANAIPFVNSNDPRVVVKDTGSKSFDSITQWYVFKNFGRDDPIALVTGTDAQLIIAEAQLNGNSNTANGGNAASWAQMTATLNALRTAPPKLGIYQPAAMPVLVAPATAAAARALFFREKAFWQFARGERFEDLRRLQRQYGLTQDLVWPTGNFEKGGSFGTNVNFPVPVNAGNGSETANPNHDALKCITTTP
jgi:hypothetical protein